MTIEDPVVIYSILGGSIAFIYALSLMLIKAYLTKKRFQKEVSVSKEKEK
ncbi:MAG: hypothetical protein ACP5GI_04470 [Sulfolobales archaeon]